MSNFNKNKAKWHHFYRRTTIMQWWRRLHILLNMTILHWSMMPNFVSVVWLSYKSRRKRKTAPLALGRFSTSYCWCCKWLLSNGSVSTSIHYCLQSHSTGKKQVLANKDASPFHRCFVVVVVVVVVVIVIMVVVVIVVVIMKHQESLLFLICRNRQNIGFRSI